MNFTFYRYGETEGDAYARAGTVCRSANPFRFATSHLAVGSGRTFSKTYRSHHAMKNIKTQQLSTSATSLPHATPHLVSHLYDSPMTFDEYESLLRVCSKQISQLRTLFSTIQLDPDVEEGFQISNLAEIGESMASSWLREIRARQQDCKVALAKSQP